MGLRTFTFNGTKSDTMHLFIVDGGATYNAPERDVEMISIPGRNGAFALDRGRFENVEVTYHVCVDGSSNSNFISNFSSVRSWLCSPKGYCRLVDDYNPNEYRMAIYKSGLEVDEAFYDGCEFDIVFECKPQHFLTSGETATAVANNGTLSNPTLFDSSPMLEVYGYGYVKINGGESITVTGEYIGDTIVKNATSTNTIPTTFTIDDQYANTGNSIKISSVKYEFGWKLDDNTAYIDASNSTWSTTGTGYATIREMGGTVAFLSIYEGDSTWSFVYGTSATKSVTATFNLETLPYGTLTGTATVSIAYDGADSFTISTTATLPSHFSAGGRKTELTTGDIILNSTQSTLGNPIYVDLDIGEAYKIENDVAVSVNNAVTIPAELPKLVPGTNTFTYNNTITQFKVVPRWWKV